VAVEVKQIEGDQHNLCGPAFQLVLQHLEVSRAISRGSDHFAVDDRGARLDLEGFGSNLLKPLGPVVTPAREHLHDTIFEVNLDAVSVEFDLVDPAIAARGLLDGGGKRRLNKAGIRRFDAYS